MTNTAGYLMPYEDIIIVRSFAEAVKAASTIYKLDICSFMEKAVQTDAFAHFDEDYTLHGQSPRYIVTTILDEIGAKGECISHAKDPEMAEYDGPTAYWMGYVFMYWKIKEGRDGAYFKNYSVEDIYWAYDTLHTQSVDYAIGCIKEEYEIRPERTAVCL